jgi:hypothetical protein
MTPNDIITYANQRYNSVNDTFFPDTEAYKVIWQGCNELAVKAKLIERSFTTPTVAGTQSYDYPELVFAIKRITWNGIKLVPIGFREDDILSEYNAATTSMGSPQAYVDWGNEIQLRPIPSAAYSLKVYGYCYPQEVTSVSTLEIPAQYHFALVDLLLAEKSAKNKNYEGAEYYRRFWNEAVQNAIADQRKKKRANGFRVVTDIDMVPESYLGSV